MMHIMRVNTKIALHVEKVEQANEHKIHSTFDYKNGNEFSFCHVVAVPFTQYICWLNPSLLQRNLPIINYIKNSV